MNIPEMQQIVEQFGLNGQSSIIKDQIRIDTGKDVKCIKKANYSVERLMFIYELKEHLIRKGFVNIDRFFTGPDGKPYLIYGSDIFILTDWIDGRECDLGNIIDVKSAVDSLAKFHKATEGFNPSENIKVKSEVGKLPVLLKKRSEELLKLKKLAQKGKNRFDFLFLENVDFFNEKCINSLTIIDSPEYKRLAAKAEKVKEICHREYSYHNLTITKDGTLYVINFDFCCYEIRVYDIASLLRKIMSECSWDIEVAKNVINWYDSICKLDEDEMKMIYALLEYPQKFWRIANRYYNSRRSRPEAGFYNKLLDVVKEKDAYSEFLTEFKKIVGC